MKVWRLARGEHVAPSGEGAKKYGGRWNPPGLAVVYTSESLALAALEALVQADGDIFPTDLVILSAEILDTVPIQTIFPKALPSNWNQFPAPPALHIIGVDWVRTNKAVGLRVPSAVIAQEHNVLVNPSHPNFAHIPWKNLGPFKWDPRLGTDIKT